MMGAAETDAPVAQTDLDEPSKILRPLALSNEVIHDERYFARNDLGHGSGLRAGHRRSNSGGSGAGEISSFRKPGSAGMKIWWGPGRFKAPQ